MPARSKTVLSAAAVLALSAPARSEPPGIARGEDADLYARRHRVVAATVTLPTKSCAGSVVGASNQVLTAAHCVPAEVDRLPVVTRDGRRHVASVAKLDRENDTALLVLDENVNIVPLEWAPALPRAGDPILFVGRVDRRSRAQVAHVERLGRCPSLPEVPNAIFTTLEARPGDSGAPIVDEALRVLGVIHGGVSCHIAAPVADLARRLQGATEHAPGPMEDEHSEPATSAYRLGPFLFQRTENGFRLRFRFRFGSDPDDAENERTDE